MRVRPVSDVLEVQSGREEQQWISLSAMLKEQVYSDEVKKLQPKIITVLGRLYWLIICTYRRVGISNILTNLLVLGITISSIMLILFVLVTHSQCEAYLVNKIMACGFTKLFLIPGLLLFCLTAL